MISIDEETISISLKNGNGIEYLKERLIRFVNTTSISDNESIVTNLNSFEELPDVSHTRNRKCDKKSEWKESVTGDFLSINIRQCIFTILRSITGEVTTDTLLGNIFGKFCIGK